MDVITDSDAHELSPLCDIGSDQSDIDLEPSVSQVVQPSDIVSHLAHTAQPSDLQEDLIQC